MAGPDRPADETFTPFRTFNRKTGRGRERFERHHSLMGSNPVRGDTMFRTDAVAALVAASMLVLAGCTGGVPGGAGGGASDAAMSDDSGTVTLYVSDQPGAMGDFEHLNVTVDKVAYHRANASGDTVDADDAAENETEADAEAEGEADAEVEAESDGEGPESEEGWETYDVEDTTVDLTELQGENATVVGQQRLENGTYDKVFLYVSDVNGTLKDGNSTQVKLPSGKLQVEKEFTVGQNESLDFVFDATVVKAGKSGKYVLTPVVSESGTDVPIKEVERDDESGVSARFVGSVDRGGASTVKVTQKGQAVAGATVEINDQEYTTAGDGTVMFDVPADAEEVEVEVEYADGEVELTRKFPAADDEDEAEGEAEAEAETDADDEADEDEAEAEGEVEVDGEVSAESEQDAESEDSDDSDDDDSDDDAATDEDGQADGAAEGDASAEG
jgi:hypothetical protein